MCLLIHIRIFQFACFERSCVISRLMRAFAKRGLCRAFGLSFFVRGCRTSRVVIELRRNRTLPCEIIVNRSIGN